MSDDAEKAFNQYITEAFEPGPTKIERLRLDWSRARTLRKWGCVNFEKHYARIKHLAN